MTEQDVARWPYRYQSRFRKLVDWEDHTVSEARAIIEEMMRKDAERKAG